MCFPRADSLTERTTNSAPLSVYGSPNAVQQSSAHLRFIYPQYGIWQQMPLLPILTLLLLTAHCVSSPVAASYPCSLLSSLTSHSFYFSVSVSVQEMSSATMKSLTVLSVYVCAGVYQRI